MFTVCASATAQIGPKGASGLAIRAVFCAKPAIEPHSEAFFYRLMAVNFVLPNVPSSRMHANLTSTPLMAVFWRTS
jgi:hypothetical protein